jgi:hypothetical protein
MAISTSQDATGHDSWPELPYDAWKDTYATLHMWTQVVGKITLGHAPPLNHSWGVALQITPRGLTTPALIRAPFVQPDLRLLRSPTRHRNVRPASALHAIDVTQCGRISS